jgi:hypothetical protein
MPIGEQQVEPGVFLDVVSFGGVIQGIVEVEAALHLRNAIPHHTTDWYHQELFESGPDTG